MPAKRKKMPIKTSSKSDCCCTKHSKAILTLMGLVIIGLGGALWLNYLSLNTTIAAILVLMGLKKIHWAMKL